MKVQPRTVRVGLAIRGRCLRTAVAGVIRRFRLLGPVEVSVGDAQVQLGGRKPKALLVALLVDAGHVVAADRLSRAIWDDGPPASARALIQTYVSGLRRSLRTTAGDDLIATHPVGYVIHVRAGELDSDEFERLAGEGWSAAAKLRQAEAVEAYGAALAQWRGPAFGGVGESFLKSQAARLDEFRLSVTEQRTTSELALGRHERIVGELSSLVSQHPTRERLRRDLMVVMYRLGRRSDALALYRQGREVLVDELGIEPGQELRAVHDAILRSDDTVLGWIRDPGVTASSVRPAQRIVPSQESAALPDFIGQVREAAAVTDLLSSGSSMPMSVISGPGGSGKSALASYVSQRIQGRYPDGQLYVELRGTSETPARPVEVLGRILRQFGGVPADSLEERVADYRSLLARRRVLVVLDDARDELQVRPLIPGSAGSGLLITSRNRLAALAGTGLIELDVFTAEEALELLSRVAGRKRLSAEPEAAMSIVRRCDRLPPAILIAGDQAIRASIELGYHQVDEQAERVLRLLGLLGISAFPAWVAGALAEVSLDVSDRALEQLVDAQLLAVEGVEGVDGIGLLRYRMHDLIRLFARERAESEEPADARELAVTAVLRRRVLSTGSWPPPTFPVAAADRLRQIARRPWLNRSIVNADEATFVIHNHRQRLEDGLKQSCSEVEAGRDNLTGMNQPTIRPPAGLRPIRSAKLAPALVMLLATLTSAPSMATAARAAPPSAADGGIGVLFNCGTYPANQPMTRGAALVRARSWIDAGVPYSQSACHSNAYGSYHTDCSGYVSMAWGLTMSYATDTIHRVSHTIPRADLRPGDALNIPNDHMALFVRWADAARTMPVVREQHGPVGTRTEERTWSAAKANPYTPIRYDNIREDAPATGRFFHNVRRASGGWSGANPADGNGSILSIAAATTPNGDMHLATTLPREG